jgi:hypothetical protein
MTKDEQSIDEGKNTDSSIEDFFDHESCLLYHASCFSFVV